MKSLYLFFAIFMAVISGHAGQSGGDLPVYDGTSLPSVSAENLQLITDKLDQLEAGYETRLGKSYLDNRIQLREEIQKALSEMDLSVDLFQKTFDVGGYDIRPKISAGLETQRAVRLVSQGEVAEDKTPGTYQTRFLVSTAVSLYKRAGVESPLSSGENFRSSLGLYSYETGVSVQKISFVNSLEDYMQRSQNDEVQIRSLLESEKNIESRLALEKSVLEDQIKKPKSKTPTGRLAEKYTISEQLRIFLEGLFSEPKNTAHDFYKISAQDLKDDKLLKKDEILVKSYYVKQTLPSLSLKLDLSSLFASKPYIERNLFTVLRVGFQKGDDGQIFIKTQLEEYPEWNIDFNVNFLTSLLKIYRANYKSSKINISEKLYSANLNDPVVEKTINMLFDRLHRAIHSEEEFQQITNAFEENQSHIQKVLD